MLTAWKPGASTITYAEPFALAGLKRQPPAITAALCGITMPLQWATAPLQAATCQLPGGILDTALGALPCFAAAPGATISASVL